MKAAQLPAAEQFVAALAETCVALTDCRRRRGFHQLRLSRCSQTLALDLFFFSQRRRHAKLSNYVRVALACAITLHAPLRFRASAAESTCATRAEQHRRKCASRVNCVKRKHIILSERTRCVRL